MDPESLLAPLGGGLWLLRAGRTDAQKSSVAALLTELPQLGGVRVRAAILGAAADARGLLRALAAAPPPLQGARWSLRYEVHYPGADHNQLPFCSLRTAPELCIGLGALLGPGFIASGAENASGEIASGAESCDTLLVLETKRALIICRPCGGTAAREPPPPRAPLACMPRCVRPSLLLCGLRREKRANATSSKAASAEAAAATDATDLRLPAWVPKWELRPFAFSASLDPLVAVAAVNLAACTHSALQHESGAPRTSLRSLHVHDPCCGSGTVLAAALALGHSASGSDLRAEFMVRTQENLTASGLEPTADATPVSVHDATRPFPPGTRVPDLVVSNPPWGKNFGSVEDSVSIICNVAKELAGATMCWLGSALALEAVAKLPGVKLLRHARLGGVELMLLQTGVSASGKAK